MVWSFVQFSQKDFGIFSIGISYFSNGNKSIHMRSSVASCAVDKVIHFLTWWKSNQNTAAEVSIEKRTLQSAHFMFHTSSSFEKPYKEHRSGKEKRGYCAVSNVLTSLIQFLLDVSLLGLWSISISSTHIMAANVSIVVTRLAMFIV